LIILSLPLNNNFQICLSLSLLPKLPDSESTTHTPTHGVFHTTDSPHVSVHSLHIPPSAQHTPHTTDTSVVSFPAVSTDAFPFLPPLHSTKNFYKHIYKLKPPKLNSLINSIMLPIFFPIPLPLLLPLLLPLILPLLLPLLPLHYPTSEIFNFLLKRRKKIRRRRTTFHHLLLPPFHSLLPLLPLLHPLPLPKKPITPPYKPPNVYKKKIFY
jgi:hypothetical protein